MRNVEERVPLPAIDDMTVFAIPHANSDMYRTAAYTDVYAHLEDADDLSFHMLRTHKEEPPFYLFDWYTTTTPDAARHELITFASKQRPSIFTMWEANTVEPPATLSEDEFSALSLVNTRSMRAWRNAGDSQSLSWRKPIDNIDEETFESKFIAFMDCDPTELHDLIERTRTAQPKVDVARILHVFHEVYTTYASIVH